MCGLLSLYHSLYLSSALSAPHDISNWVKSHYSRQALVLTPHASVCLKTDHPYLSLWLALCLSVERREGLVTPLKVLPLFSQTSLPQHSIENVSSSVSSLLWICEGFSEKFVNEILWYSSPLKKIYRLEWHMVQIQGFIIIVDSIVQINWPWTN